MNKISEKLLPPTGPHNGLERWVCKIKETLKDERDEIVVKASAMILTIQEKLSDCIESNADKLNQKTNLLKEKIINKFAIPFGKAKVNKKVKLIVVGDSLVCGVGCDNDPNRSSSSKSPVLPVVLARVLSMAMRADVEWISQGQVGATVADVRNIIIPEIKQKLQNSIEVSNVNDINNRTNNTNTEVYVVVICGLNDWKTLLENFPFGNGPVYYRNELASLISDIRQIGTDLSIEKFKIFLPSIPIECGSNDPTCSLAVRPLSYFVDAVSWLFDEQKKYIAMENEVSYENDLY